MGTSHGHSHHVSTCQPVLENLTETWTEKDDGPVDCTEGKETYLFHARGLGCSLDEGEGSQKYPSLLVREVQPNPSVYNVQGSESDSQVAEESVDHEVKGIVSFFADQNAAGDYDFVDHGSPWYGRAPGREVLVAEAFCLVLPRSPSSFYLPLVVGACPAPSSLLPTSLSAPACEHDLLLVPSLAPLVLPSALICFLLASPCRRHLLRCNPFAFLGPAPFC